MLFSQLMLASSFLAATLDGPDQQLEGQAAATTTDTAPVPTSQANARPPVDEEGFISPEAFARDIYAPEEFKGELPFPPTFNKTTASQELCRQEKPTEHSCTFNFYEDIYGKQQFKAFQKMIATYCPGAKNFDYPDNHTVRFYFPGADNTGITDSLFTDSPPIVECE